MKYCLKHQHSLSDYWSENIRSKVVRKFCSYICNDNCQHLCFCERYRGLAEDCEQCKYHYNCLLAPSNKLIEDVVRYKIEAAGSEALRRIKDISPL